MGTSFIDPYIDPTTGILANIVGATTQRALDELETEATYLRSVELLNKNLMVPTADAREIQAIHRHLFQDIYSWAGQIRTVDMRKNDSDFFMPAATIKQGLNFFARHLREYRMLKNMPRSIFIDKLATLYDELNYIHPFREGNGRTQRIFWNRIAREAQWPIDWSATSRHINIQASRLAMENNDLTHLKTMFDSIIPKHKISHNHPPPPPDLPQRHYLGF